MKKETLEEAAYKEYPWYGDIELRESFCLGAKWQQEQNKNLYSEEDMINFAYHYMNERKDFGARALTPELLIKYLKKNNYEKRMDKRM